MKSTRGLRAIAALALAFVPLFFASPAKANPLVNGDTIQFTYYWSAYERTFTDANVTIVVTNNITNKIGGNGEVIDTYRITLGDQVIERTEKHDALTYSFQVVGTQTLRLEGIDNGYWGGYYGPIMQILVESSPTPSESPQVESQSPSVTESPTTSSESGSPTESATTSAPTESPSTESTPILWDYVINEGWAAEVSAPEGSVFSRIVARYIAFESDCGIDVSEQVGAILLGTSSGIVESNNGVFGDPCPGWYKKLVVSVEYTQVQIIVPPTPQPEPQPPVSTPEPAPSPEPQPEPSPEPVPIEPTESPSVEPQPEITPTPEPSPEPQQTEEPTKSAQPIKPTPLPEPTKSEPVTPEPEPKPEPEKPVEAPEITADAPVEELLEAVADINPSELTSAQVEILSEAAVETLATSEQGSEEYQQALEVLAVIAEADDQELPAELAAIPLVGDVAGAVLEVFNDLGNIGADMAPEQRERAEETVVAAVIVGQVAQVASAAAASASMAASRK
jgi:hypothetical protein